MKYKFLLAIMLLLSGCSTPPKEEVKKETPSVSFVAVEIISIINVCLMKPRLLGVMTFQTIIRILRSISRQIIVL